MFKKITSKVSVLVAMVLGLAPGVAAAAGTKDEKQYRDTKACKSEPCYLEDAKAYKDDKNNLANPCLPTRQAAMKVLVSYKDEKSAKAETSVKDEKSNCNSTKDEKSSKDDTSSKDEPSRKSN